MPVIGTCRLCLTSSVALQHSHILPHWGYLRCKETPTTNPIVTSIQRGSAVETSTELKEHLLCTDCERKFCKEETYVAEITDTSKGPAELLSLIGPDRAPCDETEAIEVGRLQTDRVVRFALSVFWRADVCTLTPECNLGPSTSAALRTYLDHAAPLPNTINLAIGVCEEAFGTYPNLAKFMERPVSQRLAGYDVHYFVIAGLRFLLASGMHIHPGFKVICPIHSKTKGVVTITPQTMQTVASRYLENAIPKGKLVRRLHSLGILVPKKTPN